MCKNGKEEFKKNCLACDKEFYCKSNSKYNTQNYCSRECGYKNRTEFPKLEHITLICRKCNGNFIVNNKAEDRRRGCCNKCNKKKPILKRICEYCNSEFEKPDTKLYSKTKFCSRLCFNKKRKTSTDEKQRDVTSYVCCRCNVNKSVSEFQKSSSNRRGLRYYCKDCDRVARGCEKSKRVELITKVCKQCETEFNKPNWKLYKNTVFCSKLCANINKKLSRNKSCLYCKNAFECKNSVEMKNRKLCSKKCVNQYLSKNSITKVCEFCNIDYSCKDITKNKDRKYCSIKCAGIYSSAKRHESVILEVSKVCGKCKIDKPYSEYYKRNIKSNSRGINYYCIECQMKINDTVNYTSVICGNKICKKCNIEKEINNFYKNKKSKDGRGTSCKSCCYSYCKKYRESPDKIMASRLRSRIRVAVKKGFGVKSNKTINLLGCDFVFYKKYFESLFTKGMSWQLFLDGEIHIDHIIPCSRFDLTKAEEQYKCFNYINTQPLWKSDNLSKGDKLNYIIKERFTV